MVGSIPQRGNSVLLNFGKSEITAKKGVLLDAAQHISPLEQKEHKSEVFVLGNTHTDTNVT